MHNRFQNNQEKSARDGHATRIFSRAQDLAAQRINLNLSIVEVSPILEEVLGADVSMEIQCEQDLPPILGVANMAKVAVIDMCSSARKAMPKGGRLEIGTRVQMVEESRAGRYLEQRVSEFVCVTVRYEGFGDRPEEVDNEEVSKSLERVYGIAQQHCGWLEVTHGPGETTALDLFLPVAKNNEARNFFDNTAVEIAGGNETILLVEDEIDLLSLTREILERYGYHIITAPSGVAALKIWAEHKNEIHLLLTDMRMPEGITGRELAERLMAEKPDLKVIYVSGYSIEGPYAGDLREGDNYLTKPYTPPGLAQIIRRRLDRDPHAELA